jgi:hypothetical protein
MIRVQDRIRDIVRARDGQPLCTRCLARMVGAARRAVEDAARRIEGDVEFDRSYGVCAVCAQDRLVLFLRSPRTPSTVAQ